MNPTAEACLSPDELRDFALGRLPESRSECVASHIETCVVCEDTISSLDGTADSLIDHLQIPPAEIDHPPKEYQVAMQQMQHNSAAISGRNVLDSIEETNISQSRDARFIRDYQIISVLGAGGMGTVYKAIHTKLDRVVALKLLPTGRIGNSEAIARFQREMKAIGKLDHPVIVRATDAGEDDNQHFLAMEFVDGLDVAQLIERHGPLAIPDACEIIRQAATGLQHVHRQALVHRDIKPSNLMVTTDGQVKVLDLGLALLGEQQDELTTVGQLMGTIDYMAPEQCDDSHDVDHRADIYSLGATLFKMLTGTAPFETNAKRSPFARIRALANEEAPQLSERMENVPQSLERTVQAMLSRDPENRPQSSDKVVEALSQHSSGHDLTKVMGSALAAESPATTPRSMPEQPSRFAGHSAGHVPPIPPTTERRTSGGFFRFGMMTLIILCAAIVFRLQTDRGELVVECNVPNVEIKLLKDGALHQELSLKQGTTSLSVYAGKYEIVIPGQSDSIVVTANKFRISRGSKIVAEIRKAPASSSTVVAAEPDRPEPTYEGVSLSEWKLRLNDRSHNEMKAAIAAVGILGVDTDAAGSARLIYGAVKHLFRHSADMTQTGFHGQPDQGVRLGAVTAVRSLLSDPEGVQFLRELLTEGDTTDRRFAVTVLTRVMQPHIGYDDAAQMATGQLVPALLKASHDSDVAIRIMVANLLYDSGPANPAVVDRLVQLLASDDVSEMMNAAQVIFDVAPDKRRVIGDRYLNFYLTHKTTFDRLRDEGKSSVMVGSASFYFMQILHAACECGVDSSQIEEELVATLTNSDCWISHRAQAAFLLSRFTADRKQAASVILDVLTRKDDGLTQNCRIENYQLASEPGVPKTRQNVRFDELLVESIGTLESDAVEAIDHLNSVVSLSQFGTGNFTVNSAETRLIHAAIRALRKTGLNADSVKALERHVLQGDVWADEARQTLQSLPSEELDRLRNEGANTDTDGIPAPE